MRLQRISYTVFFLLASGSVRGYNTSVQVVSGFPNCTGGKMSITSSNLGPDPSARPNITTTTIQAKTQRPEPITCLTAYDYATARLVDEGGIDMILVGDSLAQVVLGYDSTLPVTIDEMLHHTRAVRRAVRSAMVIADMPFGTYQGDTTEGVRNAVRFVKEAGAEAVKVEGGIKRVELIRRMLDAEVPVLGHIGLTPQSLHKMGGYKVQGKDLSGIEGIMKDAVALERAGVFSLVLKGLPREAAVTITREVFTHTIGICSGPECDSQVLVFHDIVNLTFAPPAKFVRRYGDAAALLRHAVAQFKTDVESGSYPSDAESYHLPKETRADLEAILRRKELKAHAR